MMAGIPDSDATKVIEKIRAATYADQVEADMLQSIYAIEHQKQFEEERGTVESALRELIAAAVKESS